MHCVIVLSMLVVSVPRLVAQADVPPPSASNDTPQRAYKQFLLIRQDGQRIEGHDASLTADRLTGTSTTGQALDISPQDIRTLYTAEGSRAGVMALYGGLLGLALTGTIVLDVALDSRLTLTNKAPPVFTAFIGGGVALGALIGAAIGAASTDWHVEPIVAPGKRYALQLSHSL